MIHVANHVLHRGFAVSHLLLRVAAVDGYMLVWDFRAIGSTQAAAGQAVPVIEPVLRMQVGRHPGRVKDVKGYALLPRGLGGILCHS